MKKNPFLIACMAAVALASCALPPAPPNKPMNSPVNPTTNTILDGTQWNLNTLIDSTGASMGALPNVTATLEFKAGRATGKGSCNNYFTSYTQADDQLTFTGVGSTRMACQPDVMAQETAFFNALNTTASFAITGEQLNLRDKVGKVLATFDRNIPLSLSGREWRMMFVNNGKGGAVSAVIGSEVTATFGDDGNVSGNGGCNGYSATYNVEGDALKIEAAISTLKACADNEVTQQEQQFFAALTNVTTYRISGMKLELRDGGGALQASFETN